SILRPPAATLLPYPPLFRSTHQLHRAGLFEPLPLGPAPERGGRRTGHDRGGHLRVPARAAPDPVRLSRRLPLQLFAHRRPLVRIRGQSLGAARMDRGLPARELARPDWSAAPGGLGEVGAGSLRAPGSGTGLTATGASEWQAGIRSVSGMTTGRWKRRSSMPGPFP